jgi:hypothetical protein
MRRAPLKNKPAASLLEFAVNRAKWDLAAQCGMMVVNLRNRRTSADQLFSLLGSAITD